MGTRGLTCVVLDGEYKVAQYGQWDHYPSGQGATILEFVRDKMNRELFIARLKDCRFISDDDLRLLWSGAGAIDSNFVDMVVAGKFKEVNPQLSRDIGGDVLQFIQESTGEIKLTDSLDFAQESFSCEWVYVIDLDKNVLEVYEGFNKKPVPADNRFQGKMVKPYLDADCQYGAVVLHTVYSLDALPTDEQFITDLSDPDEDEDGTMTLEEVITVIDNIGNNGNGNEMITDRLCNYLKANIDEFMESFEDS